MLGINNKHTVSCGLAGELQAYIDSNYTKEEAEAVRGRVQDVEKQRDLMTKTLAKSEVTASDLKVVETYHNTLSLVTARFPFSDIKTGGGWFSKAKVSSVKCTFTYSEAFKEKKKVAQSDDQFEHACVCFNLAAITSQLALALKKQDNLKEACTLYRSAAGILTYISNNANYTAFGNVSTDLQHSTLEFFSAVMLAQAQACFVEMAIVQRKSPDLVSKLAQGAFQLYRSALAALTGDIKDMLARYEYSWFRHMLHQQHCFAASAMYFRSRVAMEQAEEGDAKQFGVEIGYLQQAAKFIADAVGTSSGLNSSAIQARTSLDEQIQDRLKKATKENDVIYFSSIPRPDQLGEIEAKVVVSVVAPPWASNNASSPVSLQSFDDDPFSRLVPAKVHEDAKLFEGRVGELLHQASEAAREDTARLNGMLASMGLPASIQVLQKDTGLPPKLWGEVREVQLKGGIQAIAEAQDRVMQAAAGCAQIHAEIKRKLTEEHKEDEDMRARFGVRWNRRPSPQITADLLKTVDTIDGYFAKAHEADEKIAREWQESFERMAVLEMSKDQIEATMPSMPDSIESQKPQIIATLETLLVGANDLINRRDATIRQLAQTATSLNIIPVLMNKDAKSKTFDQLCNEGLQPVRPIENSLLELRGVQADLLQQIHVANENFTKTRAPDPVLEERQQVLQNLNTSVECWNRLMKNLNEGLKFYLELSSTKLEPLRLNVEDYVVARDLEKATILGQLTEEFARMGASAGGAASNPNLYGPSSNPAYNIPTSPVAARDVKMHVQPSAGNGPSPTGIAGLATAYPASAYGSTPGSYQPPFSNNNNNPPPSSYSSYSSSAPPPSNNNKGLPASALPYQQTYQPYQQQPQQPQYQQYQQQPYQQQPYQQQPPPQYQQQPYQQQPQYNNYQQPPPSQGYSVPTASPPGQWACAACTFLNNVGSNKCSMCGTSK